MSMLLNHQGSRHIRVFCRLNWAAQLSLMIQQVVDVHI